MGHIVGRGIVDSRPFQIFEGSNEMLYTQIAEIILKKMKEKKETNFYSFLSRFELTSQSVVHFSQYLRFDVASNFSQRKRVDLGKIIARLICMDYVLELQGRGFHKQLIDNSLFKIQMDVAHLTLNFKQESQASSIVEYRESSNWVDFMKKNA